MRPAVRLAPLFLALSPATDTIHLESGAALEDVVVLDELLAAISYTRRGESEPRSLDPDQVLFIDYERLPPELEQAEALLSAGDPSAALEVLSTFADSVLHGPTRKDRPPWAAALALERSSRLRLGMGDLEGAIRGADLVMHELAGSRHLPSALLLKAEAQRRQGASAAMESTLSSLRTWVEAESRSERWNLEADLLEIRSERELSAPEQRERIAAVAARAGAAHPSVQNRARVAEAETYLEGEEPDLERARELLELVVADRRAEADTLAAAYTGLGDCWLRAPGGADLSAALEQALLAYMRVVIGYADQVGHVQKALFFAGRACDLLGDPARRRNARRLYGALIDGYPSSPWADEARKLRQ